MDNPIPQNLAPQPRRSTLGDLTDESMADLAVFAQDLCRAREAGDWGAQVHLAQCIAELFVAPPVAPVVEHEDAVGLLTNGRNIQDTLTAAEELRTNFLLRYLRLKAEAQWSTRERVAQGCGVHPNTIAGLENKETFPQWRTVERLARGFTKHLGRPIHTAWLLGHGDDAFPSEPTLTAPQHAALQHGAATRA